MSQKDLRFADESRGLFKLVPMQNQFEVNLKDYVQKGKVDDISEALLLAVYGFKKYDESTGEQ